MSMSLLEISSIPDDSNQFPTLITNKPTCAAVVVAAYASFFANTDSSLASLSPWFLKPETITCIEIVLCERFFLCPSLKSSLSTTNEHHLLSLTLPILQHHLCFVTHDVIVTTNLLILILHNLSSWCRCYLKALAEPGSPLPQSRSPLTQSLSNFNSP